MRISYLHQYFNRLSDTGGTRSYDLARYLVKKKHEVHIITTNRSQFEQSQPWVETIEDGIHVHWANIPYSNQISYPRRIGSFLKFAWLAAHKAVSVSGDLVFATSTPLTIALPAVYASRRCHVPMVFEVRDLWPEVPIAVGALKGYLPITGASWLERFAYGNSERIVALSPDMKEGIVRTGYPERRVHVISNIANLDLFSVPRSDAQSFRGQFDWLQDRPLVVYAGTMGLINGVEYMARLAAAMYEIDAEVRFLAIGKGRREEHVRGIATDLGVLNRNFFMMKPVPKAQLPKVLLAADISTSFVIDVAELWANSANKFFDALAAGTPIAINYQGWQADLLRETGAGLVLPADDFPNAARLLADLLSDKERLAHAGKAARNLAETRFSADLLSERFEQVLLEAAEDSCP